jgi:PAS domain S-box-containing protein
VAAFHRLPLRDSIRFRLPLVVVLVLTPVTMAFLWTADRQLNRILIAAGGERAQAVADQLAGLMSENAARGLAQVQRIAREPALSGYLGAPDEAHRATAVSVLQALAADGQPPAVLLDAAGHEVLSGASPRASSPEFSRDVLATAGTAGIGPFVNVGGQPEAAVVADVGASPRLGALVVTRRLSTAPNAGLISRLVGDGATVAMGSGSVWTNFTHLVAAPPMDVARRRVAEYPGEKGEAQLGAMSPVRGTPWGVVVAFPESVLVAPAHGVVGTTGFIAVLFVALAAGIVALVTERFVSPLKDLGAASEAIAAGNYGTRIDTSQRGELAQVAGAFNTMAARVEETHAALDARVRERTASLETALRELDRFFSVSIDLFCIAGFDGRFHRVNDAWRTVLGWDPEELTSRPYVEFVHPDDRQATVGEAVRLADGQRVVSFENRYRHKDGSYRWLRWVSAPVPEDGLIYASARDVTREREVARELETRVTELADANQELESFSYSVSHDLRAPLRHITGFAALLERSAGEELAERDRRYLQTITGAAQRMGLLIDDLLALSRTGRVPLATRRVNLTEVVEAAQRDVADDLDRRQVDWAIQPLPEVDGDPDLLRVAFVNLLSNAVKYSAPRARPRIEVGVCVADGRTAVFVRDNGVGFDPQYAHKLFGVFQRLHSSDDFDGTGIGLATVRRIIRRHGGDVWAEGALDQGATFYVTLPHLASGGGTA